MQALPGRRDRPRGAPELLPVQPTGPPGLPRALIPEPGPPEGRAGPEDPELPDHPLPEARRLPALPVPDPAIRDIALQGDTEVGGGEEVLRIIASSP